MHEEKDSKKADDEVVPEGAIPAYLMDRKGESRAKVLSNMVKQKRKEKAGKWNVPLPKVRGVAEDEVFKVVKTGSKNCESLDFFLSSSFSFFFSSSKQQLNLPPFFFFPFVLWIRPYSQAVEEDGLKGHVCRRGLHTQAPQV